MGISRLQPGEDVKEECSENRMRLGVHFPSDIEAGKILAKRLMEFFKKEPDLNFREWFSL
jgi:hypothetical protein